MAFGRLFGGGGSGANISTLPPLHTGLSASGVNGTITINLDDMPVEYDDIYSGTILCITIGREPTSPMDWDVRVEIKKDKSYTIRRRT